MQQLLADPLDALQDAHDLRNSASDLPTATAVAGPDPKYRAKRTKCIGDRDEGRRRR